MSFPLEPRWYGPEAGNVTESYWLDTPAMDRHLDIGVQQRRREPPKAYAIPDGYDLIQRTEPDPYAQKDARDYPSISFGTLLLQDYGTLVTPDLPIGERDDTPVASSSWPGQEAPTEHYRRSMTYAKSLSKLTPPEAAKLGIDLDLLLTQREVIFCQEFLGLMAILGHQGSEHLRLGHVPPATDSKAAVDWLTGKLTPARWQQAKWNDRDWSEATGQKPMPSDYQGLIGHVAAGRTQGGSLSTVQAYPLHKLNPDTWLYVCEDGKVRVKIDSQTLLPPSSASRSYAPTCNLSVDFDPPIGDPMPSHVTHELLRKADGVRIPHKLKSYSARVLAYPAKQRLVDIAGRALATHLTSAATA